MTYSGLTTESDRGTVWLREEGQLVAEITRRRDGTGWDVTGSSTFAPRWQQECSGRRTWQGAMRALFAHEVTAVRAELDTVLASTHPHGARR